MSVADRAAEILTPELAEREGVDLDALRAAPGFVKHALVWLADAREGRVWQPPAKRPGRPLRAFKGASE
jgi:hypothetical protein